ncbi:NTP transferase domain-containing protein [Zobellella sp. DQSA1]|uniref:nucleotidyltransferase family protein n=1 Tax=Zobellella sp. DQSA1 TaxID=3342386 RepID=UPI0035BFF4A1
MSAIAALILAAGQGSRFGGCKPLARVAGGSLLQRSIDQARRLLPQDVFVVSGAWHQALDQARQRGELNGATLLHHPGWVDGLGSSLAFGVAQLASAYQGILVMLADQVAVTHRELARLLEPFDGGNIVCGWYGGRRGVPALFGANSFSRLQALSGDQGAKALLYDPGMPVCECPMPAAAIDIDTRSQLDRWRENGHLINEPD